MAVETNGLWQHVATSPTETKTKKHALSHQKKIPETAGIIEIQVSSQLGRSEAPVRYVFFAYPMLGIRGAVQSKACQSKLAPEVVRQQKCLRAGKV